MAVTTFRLRNPADGSTDTDLYDLVPLRDAFERFASGATLRLLDPDGTKSQSYPYGRRVEVQYSTDYDATLGALTVQSGETHTVASGETETYREGKNEGTVKNEGTIQVGEAGTWTTRGGFATLEPSRTTKDGMSMVEVDAVGYSHFLTREQVVKDYSSETKSDILNDLVTEFSPVVWNAANVTLEDDSAIDLALRGITPAEAISQVVAQSGEEEWGVNLDFEFFVTPQDTETSIPVTDSDVISHDLPEKGARSINKFTVYWGANEDSAWVEQDRVAQQDLADELDVSGRVVVADADSFPEITTEAEAEAMATKRLGEQSVIQTGTVTTPLGYFDTEAGDVFDLTISEAGITNEEFRVAQIDYGWGKGEVTRTIAENTGANVDELLVSLSESLTNERLQNVDPNATVLEALRVESGLTADVTASVTTKTEASDAFVLGQSQLGQGTDDRLGGGVASTASVSINSDRVTATFLNLLRDLWVSGNSAFTDLSHLSVGTGTGDASRADTALESETDRVAIERFGGVDTDQIELTATIPAGGVFADASDLAELGIQDADTAGDLFTRLTTDAIGVDATTRAKVRIRITVDDDADAQGVVTNTGQERWRDLVIGESNHEPSDFVYGDGTADPDVTDTALANQTYTEALDSTDTGATGVAALVDRVTSGEATTADFSEIGVENSGGELLARVVFDDYGTAVDVETTWRYVAVNMA